MEAAREEELRQDLGPTGDVAASCSFDLDPTVWIGPPDLDVGERLVGCKVAAVERLGAELEGAG